ncbi:hypothetical protein LZ30DRAFT_781074 [Colletotrichum cereale]|nr:hypothetical protein LZ30DRAFT_781074 [Colletotrichum cereale]
MRASAALFTLFAALAAATPSRLVSGDLYSPLEARDCHPKGECSKGGDDGTFCSQFLCCNKSKFGIGGQKCCCN